MVRYLFIFTTCKQQSSAFKTLRNRLKSVPLQTHISQLNEGVGMCQDTENTHIGIDFRSKLLLFQQMQEQRRIKVKTQVQLLIIIYVEASRFL